MYGARGLSFVKCTTRPGSKTYQFDCLICLCHFPSWDKVFAHACIVVCGDSCLIASDIVPRPGLRRAASKWCGVFPPEVEESKSSSDKWMQALTQEDVFDHYGYVSVYEEARATVAGPYAALETCEPVETHSPRKCVGCNKPFASQPRARAHALNCIQAQSARGNNSKLTLHIECPPTLTDSATGVLPGLYRRGRVLRWVSAEEVILGACRHAGDRASGPGVAPLGSLEAILQADVWGQSMVLAAEPDAAPHVLDHNFLLPHRARPYMFRTKYLQALFGTTFLDKSPMVAFVNVRRMDIELSEGETVI